MRASSLFCSLAELVLRVVTIDANTAKMKSHRVGLPTIGVMALVLLFGGFTKLSLPEESLLPSSRINLAWALQGRRLPLGRIAGFAYAQSASRLSVTEQRAFLQLLRASRKRLEAERSAWNLADLAALELVAEEPDRAVDLLESATTLKPRDAALLSDLAAAYLNRAQQDRNTLDVMRSLAAAQKALAFNFRQQEAWFNRGMALEVLRLRPEARRSWNKYLLLDPGSPWAREATVRQKRLERIDEALLWREAQRELVSAAVQHDESLVGKLIERFSQPSQIHAAEVLLAQWAAAATSNKRVEEEQLRQALNMVGVALAKFNGDYEILDAATGLDRASSNRHKRTLLTRGYRLFALGRTHQLQYRPSESLPLLKSAYEMLSQAGSPIAYWAKLYQAIALMELRKNEAALYVVTGLSEVINRERYLSLAGKIDWIHGMLLFREAQPILALGRFLRAIDIYKKIAAWEDLCASHYLAAETLEYLGYSEGASEHLWESLALFDRLVSERRLFSVLDELADSAHEERQTEIAVDFRNAVIDRARKSKDNFGLVHALRRHAETMIALGRSSEALRDLIWADKLVDKIDDPTERLEAAALTDLALGESLLQQDPRQSLALLRRAQSFYASKPDQFEVPRLYLAQYHALEALKNSEAAANVIEQGIKWYEGQAVAIKGTDFSELFAVRAGQLFDIAIERALLKSDYIGALQYSERQRLWQFAALQQNYALRQITLEINDLSFESIRKDIPGDVLLITYLSQSKKTIVFCIGRYGSKMVDIGVSGHDLAALTESYYEALGSSFDLARRREVLTTIYERILEPVLPARQTVKMLVIVPSGSAVRIPFSAALDRDSGRYLIESYSIVISPSVTEGQAFLRRRESAPLRKINTVLAVGNPALDRRILPQLPGLPLAEAEARKVLSMYEGGELLVRGEATKERVLRELPKFSIVHIAAHALGNHRFPGRSLIVLSPSDAEDGGLVYPHDIVRLDLSSVNLLVLSACRGAGGQQHATVDSMNLVIPFLAAGADSVVASLWDVSDSISFDLLPLLHREIRAGYNPSEALRRAQIKFLRSGDDVLSDPMSWAGFAVFVN